MHQIVAKVKEQIQSIFSSCSHSKFILGLSGGPDSICLAHILYTLNISFKAIHCNFHLRENESLEDETFVYNWCKHYSIPLKIYQCPINLQTKEPRKSIEMIARDMRYEIFQKELKENNCNAIAIAHNKNDQVETILLNISRGSGLNGLTGMKDFNNKNVFRPLLPFSKLDIINYLIEYNLPYRIDSSNKENQYKRNLIRNKIIPLFNEINPSFISLVAKMTSVLDEQNLFLKYATEKIIQEITYKHQINTRKLKKIPGWKSLIYEIFNPLGFNRNQQLDIINHIIQENTGQNFFSSSHQLHFTKDTIHIHLIKDNSYQGFIIPLDKIAPTFQYSISDDKNLLFSIKETTHYGERTMGHNKVICDLEKIKSKGRYLEIRCIQEGDSMYPYGLHGRQKISKILKNAKIDYAQRKYAQLLLAGESPLWLIGLRADKTFCIDRSTKKILEIELLNK